MSIIKKFNEVNESNNSIKFEKNKEYSYNDILKFIDNDDDYELEELGHDTVGESFIILKHNYKDKIYTFVLTSASTKENWYTCVYTD
jgi:hypothetical protein